jgi:hypothetical protein
MLAVTRALNLDDAGKISGYMLRRCSKPIASPSL